MKSLKKNKLTPFGKKVKKKLLDKDMQLSELAGIIGIKPQYLCYILYGKRTGEKYIENIKKVLEII